MDLAPYKIRVNGIISGIVGTPVGKREMGSRKIQNPSIPLGRIGQPEEIAEVAAFLISSKASYITNAIIPVDGGRLNSTGRASKI
jgi:NAD(P)-dependent dehydrogenase (short-subunit alcohol dehydrogenase family)